MASSLLNPKLSTCVIGFLLPLTFFLVCFVWYYDIDLSIVSDTISEHFLDVDESIHTATTARPTPSPAPKPCTIRGSAWDAVGGDRSNWSVVFVDHVPGRRRPIDIERLLPRAQIVVVHDTQTNQYGWKKLTWPEDPNPFSLPSVKVWAADRRFSRTTAFAQGGAKGAGEAFVLMNRVWRTLVNKNEAHQSENVRKLVSRVRDEMDRVNRAMGANDASPYGTHRPILLSAVVATSGAVLEMGVGDFSTPSLHHLVAERGRYVESADTDPKWLEKFSENMSTELHTFRHVPVYPAGFTGNEFDFDC